MSVDDTHSINSNHQELPLNLNTEEVNIKKKVREDDIMIREGLKLLENESMKKDNEFDCDCDNILEIGFRTKNLNEEFFKNQVSTSLHNIFNRKTDETSSKKR